MERKQFANLLNRIQLDDLAKGRQGLRRRLDPDLIATLDVVVSLGLLGVPAAIAADLTPKLLARGVTDAGPGLAVVFTRSVHRADLDRRLRDAAERVVARKRGRPRGRRKHGAAMPSVTRAP
jgi:hypothetical protein